MKVETPDCVGIDPDPKTCLFPGSTLYFVVNVKSLIDLRKKGTWRNLAVTEEPKVTLRLKAVFHKPKGRT